MCDANQEKGLLKDLLTCSLKYKDGEGSAYGPQKQKNVKTEAD